MNNTKKPVAAVLSRPHYWRTRLGAVVCLAVLVSLSAPITPLYTPPLKVNSASAEPLSFKEYAYFTGLGVYGWDREESKCLNKLWGKESAWNPKAANPHSSAFGIAQMLREKSQDPYKQISNGLRYIEHRYSTPCNAWEFWNRNYWY
jgi:hypothetical protein